MKMPRLNKKQRAYVACAPFHEEKIRDRGMRSAIFRVRKADEFDHQRTFDRAIAALAQAIAIPPEVTEWESKATFVAERKRTWRDVAKNPVVIACAIAAGVIAGIFVYKLIERLNEFPGENTAKRLLTVASSPKPVMLDPMKGEAGALGDFLFMKHRLAHYDVPEEFAQVNTLGCRVFDDEEAQRVAQIWAAEKKMQFFLFPAERDPKTGEVKHFDGWRYVDQERWTGVVREKNGVCFMAALRGGEKDLAPYLAKKE